MAEEKRIESTLKELIRANGGWVEKLHADGVQGRGTLDLLGAYRGRPFLVEVKATDGKPTPTQEALVRRAHNGGFVSGIVASVEAFEALFVEPQAVEAVTEADIATAVREALIILDPAEWPTSWFLAGAAHRMAAPLLLLKAQRDLHRAPRGDE
jgi:hypothetical protein